MLCVGSNGAWRPLPCAHATPYDRILVSGVACDLSVLCLYCFRPDTAATAPQDGFSALNRRQHSHVQPLDHSPGEHPVEHVSKRARDSNTRWFPRIAAFCSECWLG